jgi:hypothetical protein
MQLVFKLETVTCMSVDFDGCSRSRGFMLSDQPKKNKIPHDQTMEMWISISVF